VDPNAPVRFAVDLFAIDESNIAPGSVEAIERLGSQAGGQGSGGGAEERAPARDELWIPIVLAALAFLVFEWAVYERDTLARLRRSLAARFATVRSPGRSD
jgi:hypothetical protein